MDNLLLDGLVLNSFLESLSGDVLNVLVLVDLRNVFSLILDCVVVSHLLLARNVLDTLDGFVLNNSLLIGNVLNARFSLDDFSGGLNLDGANVNSGLAQSGCTSRLSNNRRLN